MALAFVRAACRWLVLVLVLNACGNEPTATPGQPSPPATVNPSSPRTGNLTPANPTAITTDTNQANLTATVGTPSNIKPAQPVKPAATRVLMKDFIGVNQDYRLYQDHTEKDFARVSKWLRDYANWYCLEPQENNYGGLDGTDGCGTKPEFFNYNAYYSSMHSVGVKILHNSLYAPAFANWTAKAGDFVPVLKEGQGQTPQQFEKHASYLYQIAGMYGSNKNFPSSNLVKSNQPTGQAFIQAIENWNEPDGWWKGVGQFTKEQFFNMTVADYDGAGGKVARSGVKQADPNMKFVMAGLATTDLSYLYGVLGYANQQGRGFPADVLNFHQYATDDKTGLPPEQASVSRDIVKASQWRDANVPGAELWVTEFGWDTYAQGSTHSRVYAGEQNQANWILRSLVLYRAAGVDKAFVFTYNDEVENSVETYFSSGLTDFANKKKPAYYYLATMQDLLGETYLDRAISTGKEDVRAYLFKNTTKPGGVFTVWKTSGNGSQLENFNLALPPGTQNCSAVIPSKASFEANRSSLVVGGDGKTSLKVGETMTFITCEKLPQDTNPTEVNPAVVPPLPTPAVAANGRLNLEEANIFETSPTATDPETKTPLTALIDEPRADPDDPNAPLPVTNWFPLSPEKSFALDLKTGFNLSRLGWFNAGGDGSGYEVFWAAGGEYGKWQPLTKIINSGQDYGKWLTLPLTASNVQYLRFVPTGEAKLGELALYVQQSVNIKTGSPLPDPANTTTVPVTSAAKIETKIETPVPPGASNFTPVGIPPVNKNAPLARAVPTENRLAIQSAFAPEGDIKSLFDNNTDTAWSVPAKPAVAQFSLSLEKDSTITKLRYFVTGTGHGPLTTIQYSLDGQKWLTFEGGQAIDTGTTYGWNDFEIKAPVKARFIRFILKNIDDPQASLYELGYYGELQVIGT